MKRFSIIFSDPELIKIINIDSTKYTTVQSFKDLLSEKMKVPVDQFIFNNPISPEQKLSSIPDNSKLEIKFLHPSENLTFIFSNGIKILVQKASKMNINSIINEFNKKGIYFSDLYIKQGFHFEIFGKQIPNNGYYLRFIPENIPIDVKLDPQTVIIPFDNKQFIFYENEIVGYVKLFLKRIIGKSFSFSIRNISLNAALSSSYNLKSDEQYGIICRQNYEFIDPNNRKIESPPMDFYTTFGSAKQFLSQLFIDDKTSNLEIVIYVGDEQIDDDNLFLKDYYTKGKFYFDFVEKRKTNPSDKSKYSPPAPLASPMISSAGNPTKISSAPQSPSSIHSSHPGSTALPKETAAPAISSSQDQQSSAQNAPKPKPKSKFKPKVKVSYTEVEEEIELYFNFDEEVERKLKVMKEQFKANTKISEIINMIKNKNEIHEEIKLRLKEEDYDSTIDEDQKIEDIESEIEQLKGKKILYVGFTSTKKNDLINVIDSSLIIKLQPQLISRSSFIGEGGTSKVYKVKFIDDSNKYNERFKTFKALKVLKMGTFNKNLTKWSDDDDDDDESLHNEEEEEENLQIDIEKVTRFFQEYEFLRGLHHPNIVQAFGFFFGDKENSPSILLELYKHNLSNSIKIIEDIYLIGIIHELSDVMKFIHEKKIIHRDLKPSNILLTNNKHVKLSDFGISKLIETDVQTATESNTCGLGTVLYMAPEIQYGGNYNEKVDVYSFGIVVHYILSRGETPIFNINGVANNKKPKMSDKINKTAQKLIYQCISFAPDDRPSFSQIVEYLNENELKLIDGIESQSDKLHEHLESH